MNSLFEYRSNQAVYRWGSFSGIAVAESAAKLQLQRTGGGELGEASLKGSSAKLSLCACTPVASCGAADIEGHFHRVYSPQRYSSRDLRVAGAASARSRVCMARS